MMRPDDGESLSARESSRFAKRQDGCQSATVATRAVRSIRKISENEHLVGLHHEGA